MLKDAVPELFHSCPPLEAIQISPLQPIPSQIDYLSMWKLVTKGVCHWIGLYRILMHVSHQYIYTSLFLRLLDYWIIYQLLTFKSFLIFSICREKRGSKGIWHRFKGRKRWHFSTSVLLTFLNFCVCWLLIASERFHLFIFPTPMPVYGGLKSEANMEVP